MNEDARPKVLIVDDVPANIKILCDVLEPKGYEMLVSSNGETALKIATHTLPDIILLDILMPPGIDGYEVCRRLKQNEQTAHIPVIFITVLEEKESIVEGFRSGGVDYINKSFHEEEVLVRIETHLNNSRLTQELLQKNQELEQEIARREQAEEAQERAEDALHVISQQEAKRWGIEGFIGQSETIGKIIDDVRKAQSVGTTSVLIMGESGTGKELIARAIHFGGERAKGPFIPVNCSTIPRELAESVLFGHVKGAFTGADKSRKGYFELASGGTLFLDEIGDMPLELQPKLLRVLEDGCIMPLGETREKHVDVRILAATNQNLTQKIAEAGFREDLYFRLARFTVNVPPLRERKEDIPLLVNHFIQMLAKEMGKESATLSQEALFALEAYHYPGNVRELKNIIEHALIGSNGRMIQPQHLQLINIPVQNSFAGMGSWVETSTVATMFEPTPVEALMIKRALFQTKGDAEAAAALLNISPAKVYPVMHDVHTLKDADPINVRRRPQTEEELILAYVKQNESISNTECRELLDVDRHRAFYLLEKMQKDEVLIREGSSRAARYYLC